jgi:hypothetical protein
MQNERSMHANERTMKGHECTLEYIGMNMKEI